MGQALELPVTLTSIDCGECGGTYAINERFRQSKWEQGGGWYCPYCQCGWGYFKDNELARTKKALEAEKARKDAALSRANEAEQNLAQALRREKRVKTRLVNGTCPCCKRTFKQLANHMARKHPDYAHEA